MVKVKEYSPPPINRREILRYAGAVTGERDIDALTDVCLDELLLGLSYRVCYTELPISFDGERICLGNLVTDSRDLGKCLSGCDRALVFAATTGLYTDRLIKRYTNLSPSRALIISAIGSERTESLCDAFCRDVAEEYMASDYAVTPRFSAGYGDLPLSLQKDIFSILQCQRHIGISLGENMLMTPTKSVTAIVGLKKQN